MPPCRDVSFDVITGWKQADCFISLGVIKVAAAQRALQCAAVCCGWLGVDTGGATEIIHYFYLPLLIWVGRTTKGFFKASLIPNLS